MEKIKIAILGYGNLGKGVECAVRQNDDMELTAVFTSIHVCISLLTFLLAGLASRREFQLPDKFEFSFSPNL